MSSATTDRQGVQVRYELTVSPKECQGILDLCKSGSLPRNFARGVKKAVLGAGLFGTMKQHGLISTEGSGAGTVITVHPHAWNEVRFRVDASRRDKEKRWREIPEEKRVWENPLAWLDDLRGATVRKGRRPALESVDVPSASVDSAPVAPAVDLATPLVEAPATEAPPDLAGIIAALEADLLQQQEATKKVAEECAPHLARLHAAEEQVRVCEYHLTQARRAQELLKK